MHHKQFELYELKSLTEAWPMLSCLKDLDAAIHQPSALLFPDKAYLAFFKQYFGPQLSRELLYFTPSSFLEYSLEQLQLKKAILTEPAYLAFIAELAHDGTHPFLEILKEHPAYFSSLRALIKQDHQGVLGLHLHDFSRKLNATLSAYGITSLEDVFVEALQQRKTPLFRSLHILGFSAKHWEHSLSLFVGLQSALQVSCFLEHLEGKAQELLIRTLETYTEKECIYLSEATHTAAATQTFAMHALPSTLDIEAKLTQDIQLHLKEHPTEDLVLVFNSSASALGLSLQLDALGIPYFSSLKRPLQIPESLSLLSSWLCYQQTLNTESLLDWLNALLCERDPVLLSQLCKKIKHIGDLYATSHAAIIVKALEKILDQKQWLLDVIRPLKTNAYWGSYQAYIRQASSTANLQWELWLPPLGAEERFQLPIQASSFLIYLEAVLKKHLEKLQQPSPYQDKKYVYLLGPGLAMHVSYANIILAHLNEEPEASEPHPFLSEPLANRFNAAVTQLGPGGESEEYIPLPQRYYLSSQSLSAYERLSLNNCILCQNHKLSQALIVVDTQAHALADVLSHPAIQSLALALSLDVSTLETSIVSHHSTPHAEALSAQKNLFSLSKPEKEGLQHIHFKRQDPTLPFDIHSFCLHPEEAQHLALPAKAWEELFRTPNAIWFKYILKTDIWPDAAQASSTPLRIGTWVHEWLTLDTKSKSVNIEDTQAWHLQVLEESEKTLEHIRTLYHSCQLNLHPSLLEHWQKAQNIALNLIETLKLAGIRYIVSEWPLPEATNCVLNQGSVLNLIGRIDAIASSNPIDLNNPLAHKDEALWILDFKTGKTPPLDIKKMSKEATGLQVALYALALRTLGFKAIRCSIVLPKVSLEPQLALEDFEDLSQIYSRMEALLKHGVLGTQPTPYSAHTYSSYPIATVAVRAAVLEAKSKLSGLS